LAWLGLAWLGLAWLGLAWLGLAWPHQHCMCFKTTNVPHQESGRSSYSIVSSTGSASQQLTLTNTVVLL